MAFRVMNGGNYHDEMAILRPPQTSNQAWTDFTSLNENAQQWFSRLRDLPPYGSTSWEYYYNKAFQLFSQLWKFQLDQRAALTEHGLQRWEIGDIASKIGQLYYNFYQRMSDLRFLQEAYVFYRAIHARQYFLHAPSDAVFSQKRLRYIARFIVVCLLLNKRQEADQLLQELQSHFQTYALSHADSSDVEEWQMHIMEIINFIKADPILPLPERPIPPQNGTEPTFNINMRVPQAWGRNSQLEWQPLISQTLLVNYYPKMIKIGDSFSIDNFRMWQALEWEVNFGDEQMVGSMADAAPETLHQHVDLPTQAPPKHLINKPTVPRLLAWIGSILDGGSDGALVLYFSVDTVEQGMEIFSQQQGSWWSYGCYRFLNLCWSGPVSFLGAINKNDNGDDDSDIPSEDVPSDGYLLGLPRSNDGFLVPKPQMDQVLMTDDLLPFTRRPMVFVVDSNLTSSFLDIASQLRGAGPFVCLASAEEQPAHAPSKYEIGKLFTLFLTAPAMAMCYMTSIVQPTPQELNRITLTVEEIYMEWAIALQDHFKSNMEDIWGAVVCDPFLCRLLLGFALNLAVASHHIDLKGKNEFRPRSYPPIPLIISPGNKLVVNGISRLAKVMGQEILFSESINFKE
eukprot:TRINITY_DN1541_c0_g2_i1.p1 TRINITY_DN1541_c0_g2~~TRINITY_DN1541_c0_g2_i1.p1  ORF type:complete len:626 (-),score=72.00 TRINITY_DN1541_c0_g2_i1:4633-6510(-)